jgi:exosortase D (VPLPA-CTERM-specific)
MAGLAGYVLGELSTIYTIIQYSFLLTLFGVLVTTMGWSGFRLIWIPFAYLIFMVPLPEFLRVALSGELQLISSELGVAVIRMFGITVFLEGNVIDLGIYQLQVAEACNGLRYLFPLMSFGFLCAVLYQGPFWHRAVVFISTVPVTILMNSFRIGVIGVLVRNYGIEQAEGFLHWFEGWFVFMACVGILFLEMWLLNKLQGDKPLLQVFGLDIPPAESLKGLIPRNMPPQAVGAALVVLIGVIVSVSLQQRQEIIPERSQLSTFPFRVAEWQGYDQGVDQVYLDALKLEDHLLAIYKREEPDVAAVQIWIAYYDSQRKGESAHSPKACLPGGGWQVESFAKKEITDVGPDGQSLTVNRFMVAKGEARQLVYYWFDQRGRRLTNEYLVKWYIFWDSMTQNRTDGALVRLTVMVPDALRVPEADAQLEDFIRAIDSTLAYYIPAQDIVPRAGQAAL